MLLSSVPRVCLIGYRDDFGKQSCHPQRVTHCRSADGTLFSQRVKIEFGKRYRAIARGEVILHTEPRDSTGGEDRLDRCCAPHEVKVAGSTYRGLSVRYSLPQRHEPRPADHRPGHLGAGRRPHCFGSDRVEMCRRKENLECVVLYHRRALRLNAGPNPRLLSGDVSCMHSGFCLARC